MNCPRCGAELRDGATFCGSCGGRIDPVQETPVYVPQQQQTANAPATPGFEPRTYETPVPTAFESVEAKPRKKLRAGAVVGIISALVVVIVLIVGLCTSWFGLTGPVTSIAKAAEKTLKAENFTIIATDEDGRTGTVYVDIDWENQDITVVQDNMSGKSYIYNGYRIYPVQEYDYYTGIYTTTYYAEDISDDIEKLFEGYEEGKKEKLDGEYIVDLLEENGMELPDEIDEKGLEKGIDKLLSKLNNVSWLKKNAGYKKTTKSGVTTHTFEPDLQELAIAAVKLFEDAFEDEDDYEDILDELEDADTDDMPEIKIELKVEDGYLVGFEMEFDGESVEFEIEDIGSTDIDTDEIEQVLATAKMDTLY